MGLDPIGKDLALDKSRNIPLSPLDVREPTGEHYHVAIDDIRDMREAAREAVLVGGHDRERIAVTACLRTPMFPGS